MEGNAVRSENKFGWGAAVFACEEHQARSGRRFSGRCRAAASRVLESGFVGSVQGGALILSRT